jgi:hypothetical protein
MKTKASSGVVLLILRRDQSGSRRLIKESRKIPFMFSA